MNITRYSQVINIDVNEVRKLMLKVSEVCNAHLDKAEYDWNKTNASNLMALDEAIAKSNVSMEKFEDSKPSLLICAELAGDFHLGYARQLTDKSSLLFDLAF